MARATVTGRIAHLLSTRTPRLVDWYSGRQAARFQASDGRRSATLNGKPIFRLTVTGRKSGEPRTVMLMLVRDTAGDGQDLLVCGSHGGAPEAPNWWKNLAATKRASVQVGAERYDVDVRVVTEAAERRRTWAALTAAYPDFASYQALTRRELPIAVLSRRVD